MNSAKLNDPENTEVIYVEQMASVCHLPEANVHAVLIRQSGNLYRELGAFSSPKDALDEIEKSFHRAKIDVVTVRENSNRVFDVFRTSYSHKGRSEGKKLGGAIVATGYQA